MKKIGMDILSNAKAAESTLKRQERKSLGEGLPKGHPLLDELEKAKNEAGGDLEGLPENHPLIREMKAAEARYEQAQEQEQESEDQEQQERRVKQAQKLDRARARREQIAQEEAETDELRTAAKEINAHVDTALSAVRVLFETLNEKEEILMRNRMNAARTARLKRLLYAFERGVSETRMSRT